MQRSVSEAAAAESAARNDIARVGKELGVGLSYSRALGTGGQLVKVAKGILTAAEMEGVMVEFAKNASVSKVEPNHKVRAFLVPNDTRYSEQWDMFDSVGGMNVQSAWDVATGSGVVVAVIDTGITPHSDLAGQTVAGYDFISDTTTAQDGNGRDSNPNDPGDWWTNSACGPLAPPSSNSSWHGTHVAGTVAALTNNAKGVAGVAFNSKVQPIRVLGRCGGSIADIADAIIWASGGSVPGVPANATPARVINLSLGGEGACSSTEQAAINSARSRNSVLIIAAGNDNANVSGFDPGNCNGVVAVAATTKSGSRASYSNYGALIDVSAPGGGGSTPPNILSTLNSGTQGQGAESYAAYAGTSMAAPHVAGLAALMLSKNASLTPDQIETLLKNNTKPLPGSCSGGCGTGIIDATKTLAAVTGGGNQAPVANFSAATSGLTVNFTDSSTDSDGSIASRSWNFGDGSTSTQTNPSKTYASAGTYTVTLTVTDNGGATNTRTQSVTVGTTPPNVLQNGVAVSNLSAAAGVELTYTMNVPAGATNLKFESSGGTGDADMYVRFGSAPTTSTYDCRPYVNGNTETCTIATAQAGTYYVKLRAYSAFSGVTLKGSYTTGGGGTFSNTTDYNIPDPGTVNSPITVSGQSGNASTTTKVTVNIVHPWRGDVQIDLVAPNGTSTRLKSGSSSDSADDVRATYTVNASAAPKNGTWQLRVTDLYSSDAGRIDDWSIQF
ncbi:S8 family serine peptidase [Tahibacter amnicola]|uniref:S8 family serine peptidase n=2 Tax=Tahibacter amnicola TaxID=2976241 RepID=A0ABY6BLK6_9GAMM|nr:S8 family serine peptidase [Tahibacter amnicola]UXI70740.1 S8 family serine peptidase [Tahibacter amnicola]